MEFIAPVTLLWGGQGARAPFWRWLQRDFSLLHTFSCCTLCVCSAQPHSSGGESSEQPSQCLKGRCLPRDPLPKRLPAVRSSRLWEEQLHVSVASWLAAVFPRCLLWGSLC